MTITREMIEQPLGPAYWVQEARKTMALQPGWIVTHGETGLFIWTGYSMGLQEARYRIEREIDRLREVEP